MDGIRQENGDDLLLENGSRVLLEGTVGPARNLTWHVWFGTPKWDCDLTPNWDAHAPADKWDTHAPAGKWLTGAPTT